MSKRIQYVSSLYVNTFRTLKALDLVKPVAPTLVLSGNIGLPSAIQTRDFLRFCSSNWDSVIYVPGPLEMGEGADRFTGLGAELSNLDLLCRRTAKINGVIYIGCPYLSAEDDKWLVGEFSKYIHKHPYIVCVTFGIPHLNMRHSSDLADNQNLQAPAYLHPQVSAWICGYSRGAKNCVFDNGVLAVYNARGRDDGLNDADGSKGWVRDAFLGLPKAANACLRLQMLA